MTVWTVVLSLAVAGLAGVLGASWVRAAARRSELRRAGTPGGDGTPVPFEGDAVDPARHSRGELRRSSAVNWFAATVLSAFASLTPALDEPSVGLSDLAPSLVAALSRVPPALLAVVVAVPLLELIWRDGLRPRLVWNDYGVMIVRAFRTETVRWDEITRVKEEGDTFKRVAIGTKGGTLAWEFDHLWLASLISKRYAARAGRNEKTLTEALTWWRHAGTDPGAVPPAVPRRPIGLYLLLIPPAIIAAVLF